MNLIFLGPPGAGKGTLSSRAKEELNLEHVSTGDLFRAAIKNETELGKQVQSIVNSGGLVPDELTIALVKEKVVSGTQTQGFILDGFPRNIPQAEALAQFMKLDAVVNFDIKDEILIERLSGRRICKKCGATFHVKFVPPSKEGICDACGGELYTRKDDELEAIGHRLGVYREQTEPLIQYYRTEKLLVDINADRKPQEVFDALLAALETLP